MTATVRRLRHLNFVVHLPLSRALRLPCEPSLLQNSFCFISLVGKHVFRGECQFTVYIDGKFMHLGILVLETVAVFPPSCWEHPRLEAFEKGLLFQIGAAYPKTRMLLQRREAETCQ